MIYNLYNYLYILTNENKTLVYKIFILFSYNKQKLQQNKFNEKYFVQFCDRCLCTVTAWCRCTGVSTCRYFRRNTYLMTTRGTTRAPSRISLVSAREYKRAIFL